MRKFIVNFGGTFVDIMAIVTIIALIFTTIKVIVAQGIMAGLGVLWAGLISFIFVFYLIYLVMSINEKISDNTSTLGKY